MEVPCCGGLEMAAKKALQNSGKFIPWQVVTISIDGKIIDESVKNCCIFVYLDEANYDYKDGKFVEVTWDELMKECTPVEVIVCE